MSDEIKCEAEYSQGIMTGVGAVVLKDGAALAVDEIVAELNRLQAVSAQKGEAEPVANKEWPDSKDSVSLIQMCDLLNGLIDGVDEKRYGLLEPWKSTYERLRERLSQSPAKPTNRYGVDAPYFHGKLSLVLRDLADYTPDELARELGRLAKTADTETLLEPEFCGGSRGEVAGLLRSARALLDKLPASGNPIDGYAADLEEWYERITDPATQQEREGAW